MADKAITELVEALQVNPGDLFVLQQDNTAKKLSGQTLINYLLKMIDGHGGVTNYEKVSSSGLKDTYRFTFADESTYDLTVTNGRAITSISQTSTSGLTRTYTIFFNDGSSETFTVTDGRSITGFSKTETSGLVDTYTIAYNDGTTGELTVTNGDKGDKGDNVYLWIKYASQEPTDASHSISDLPDNWIGIYSGALSDPPVDWEMYSWFKIKGEKGDIGDPATVVSNNVDYQVSSSGIIIPSGSWQENVPLVPQGQYLWTRITTQFNTGKPVTAYSVSRFGIDGAGSVSSVADISPDENGNVPLTAEDVGALPNSGGDMSGAINMNGQPIRGLNVPTENDQAANMGFVNQQTKKAAPRNLLPNSNFQNPVNQRGYTKWTPDPKPEAEADHNTQYGYKGGYSIDRWMGVSSATTHELMNNGIKFSGTTASNHSLQTSLENPERFVGKMLTLCAYIEENAADVTLQLSIWMGADSKKQTASTPINLTIPVGTTGLVLASGVMPDLGSYNCFNPSLRIRQGTGHVVVKWMALYEGEYTEETLPEYQPKGYGAELAECQRYYVRFASTDDMVVFSGGSNNQYGYFSVPLPVPMRSGVVPTVNYENVNIYGLTAGSAVDITGLTCYFTNFNNALLVRATHEKNAFDSQTTVMLRIRAGGYIELNADL